MANDIDKLKEKMKDELDSLKLTILTIQALKQQNEQYVLDFMDQLNKLSITF